MIDIIKNKILNKNISYNALSLVNIIIGFFFTILLGKKFGLSNETDIYFSALVIIGFLGSIVKSIWEAFSPNYIKLKITDLDLSHKIVSIILNNIIIISFVIIFLFYIITPYINVIEKNTLSYLNIFIIYLLLQNILYFNKTLLNLEHHFAAYYIVDIFIYTTSSLILIFSKSITINDVAIIILTTTLISILYQFYLIIFKTKIKYYFLFSNPILKEIYTNSIKFKIGTMIYSTKDIILMTFFTNLGTGYFSYYSYANKFAMTIAQIVNAPIVNIFVTKLNYIIVEKKFELIKSSIKNVLIQTISLFILASTIMYLLLPFILTWFFSDKVNIENIEIIKNIFFFLVIFNLVIVLETPFAKTVFVFKEFNYSIFVNLVFISIFSLNFMLESDYKYLLILLIFSQVSNLLLFSKKTQIILLRTMK